MKSRQDVYKRQTLCRGAMKISQTYARNICIPMSSDGSMVLELDIAVKGD